MSTKDNALKVTAATLFAVLCLQPILDGEYQIYVAEIYRIGRMDDKGLIWSGIYLLALLFLMAAGRLPFLAGAAKNRKWAKWLYIFPAAFFLAAMARRADFLSDYLEKFTQDSRTVMDWFVKGYTVDYNRLLRECAILLLLIYLIRLLASGAGEREKGDTGKCAFVAAPLFALLAVWAFYRGAAYVIYYGVYHNAGAFDSYSVRLLFLLCAYAAAAISLFLGKRGLLTAGAGAMLLYIVYSSGFPYFIGWSGPWGFCRLLCSFFGYGCIAAFSIVTLVSGKRGKGPKAYGGFFSRRFSLLLRWF